MADAKLQQLVADIEAKEDALSSASAANDQAQSEAQAAVATAAGTLTAKNAAHDELSTSIDALVAYVQTLK